MLSIFQIKNPQAKSVAPVTNNLPIMAFASEGIPDDAFENFKVYVIRNPTMNIMLAKTT
jgi:hypothetical protein